MKVLEKFTPPHPLNTALLFLVFNRLHTTKQVFEAIRQAKPPRFYIAADGPRENKEGEAEKVKAVREYVMKNIDWDCEVKTLFREKNLGCGKAVSEAITWFFENEEMGIILEDDCLPSQSFFWFCEELLQRYKDDMRVWHIGGCNFQNGIKRGEADYYFSKYNHIWGWAGWANRWRMYDFRLEHIENDEFINKTFYTKKEILYWKKIFHKMKSNNPIDTWDYQYTFSIWYNNGLSITPNLNLVSNIGFGADATHTCGESKLANLKAYELLLQKHPAQVLQDKDADEYTFKKVFAQKPFFVRMLNRLKKVLKGLK